MHHDIRPLSPFSESNPFGNLVSHDGVYQLCVVAGLIGVVAWIALKWATKPEQMNVKHALNQPSVEAGAQSFRTLWIRDQWPTWSLTLCISTIPAVVFGSGFFAMCILMLTVLIGLPAFVIHQAMPNKDRMRSLRKLTVMLGIPIATLVVVFQVDARIPTNAAPITQAIETYKTETGKYPETLEELMPKYLPQMPALKFVLVQPNAKYRLKDGKPNLSIPSAAGDAFAEFEYDFVNKAWVHHS